jgi:cellulose synthase/poly-beta-1,6-N-acetylglucosamine synthase-like glycosyltransferase
MWQGLVIEAISLAFTIPVLATSYYALILFLSSLRYPKSLGVENVELGMYPKVSVLVAVFNEKFVIPGTLDALKKLDYPKNRLQVVVADDSTDETREIVDKKLGELRSLGIQVAVSRRKSRQNFKSGALNQTAGLLDGDYVQLLDADSVVTPDVLKKGLALLQNHPGTAFVSFRVGHYNREQNLITRLFALNLDLGDTQTKMGSYAIKTPFSFQGGFTLLRTSSLRDAGFWAEDTVTDDADLSCKIYLSGEGGTYLSNVRIFSEDPPTLEVWKGQAARVAQGWAKCLSVRWKEIARSQKLSVPQKLALFLIFTSPVASLSWIVVTFLSGFGLILGLTEPANSIFSNPIYTFALSLPIVSYFASAVYALHVQKIMTARNLLLLPLISYTGYGMLAAISFGFLNGVRGQMGRFFRTPKSGPLPDGIGTNYFQSLRLGRTAVGEGLLAIIGLVMCVFVLFKGVWFLGLSLLGFGVLTLKSMNLSRLLRQPTTAFAEQSPISQDVAQAL